MPVKSPKQPVPKVLGLLEACRSSCHASAAAVIQSLKHLTPAQAAHHFSTADASGWTPLLYAARNGWPDVVEQCLAAGQNPHAARLQSSGNTGGLRTAALLSAGLGCLLQLDGHHRLSSGQSGAQAAADCCQQQPTALCCQATSAATALNAQQQA